MPFIQTGDVRSSGRRITTYSQTLNERGVGVSKVFPIDTLFITIAANIGDLGITGFVAACPDSLVAVRPRPSVDQIWLYYALGAEKKMLETIATQNAQANLNLAKLKPFVLTVPPRTEQMAIVEVLSAVDELIIALDRLIAKKRAIKLSAMQQLLSGRTRLAGFGDKWDTLRVGDFAQVRAGGTPSTTTDDYWNGGDIPWMTSGEIHQKQVCSVKKRITHLGMYRSSAQSLPAGTVLIALAGQGKTRGTVAVSRIDLTTNQSIAGIYPSEQHHCDYLYYNLDSRYAELRGESTGDGGRGGLNLAIIKRLEIPLPDIREQSAIASVLLAIDSEIAALGDRLDKIRAIKAGVMQQLLTGRTRMSVDAAS